MRARAAFGPHSRLGVKHAPRHIVYRRAGWLRDIVARGPRGVGVGGGGRILISNGSPERLSGGRFCPNHGLDSPCELRLVVVDTPIVHRCQTTAFGVCHHLFSASCLFVARMSKSPPGDARRIPTDADVRSMPGQH